MALIVATGILLNTARINAQVVTNPFPKTNTATGSAQPFYTG